MKNWKRFLLIVCGCFAMTSMVVFNSCEKNACSDLNCQNGSCSDGLCQCPAGWEGVECETPAATAFVGTWDGALRCDPPSMQQVQQATLSITLIEEPDKIHLNLPVLGDTLNLDGTADASEASFSSDESGIKTHVYATVDGDLIQVFLKMIDQQKNTSQVCYFTGYKGKEQ